MNASLKRSPRVVVLGGGFAGLRAVRRLRQANVRVTLIDQHNYHLFQPLLYQAATGALTPSNVATPLRALVHRQANTEVLLARAKRIIPEQKRVELAQGSIGYDYLIVATGSRFSYFGHDEWAKHAPGLKTIDDALEIRRRVFAAFEAAERESSPEARDAWMTFVIVGAGPTGVELAGAIADVAHRTLVREFRHIDPAAARVVLIDALEHVLPAYPEALRETARAPLEARGVEVLTGHMVDHVSERGVRCRGGLDVGARTVLWAAGVEASPLTRSLGGSLEKGGRVRVASTLALPHRDEIFAVGDLAYLEHEGEPLPGLASVAIQQGEHAADNILRSISGRAMLPFRFVDRGTFSVIGRGAAVGVAFGRLQLDGRLAWLAWLLIHLRFLVGLRNMLLVPQHWLFTYLGSRRGARIVTGDAPFKLARPREDEALRAATAHGAEDEASARSNGQARSSSFGV